MKIDPYYIGLLHKEFTRQLTAEEAEGLRKWLERHEHHRHLRHEVSRSWELAATPLPEAGEEEVAEELSRLRQRIQHPSPQDARQDARTSTSFRQLESRKEVYYGLVAMVILLVLAIGGLLLSLSAEVPGELTAFYSSDPTAVQQEFSLPDRSAVHLRGRSELAYLESERARSLRFSGQAFFQVARQEQRPFLIHAGGMQVQVLGTSFFVKALVGRPLEVGVASGRVAVDYQGEKYLLKEGELIRFVPGETARVQPIQDVNYFSWHTDKLDFQQSPLREVVPALERHYDIRLETTGSALLNCRFTGSFEGIALEELLEVICYSLDLSVERLENRTYLLSGAGCPKR
ncbi:FecR family protein [Cesiribacter andamanensis]|uniref:Fec operon regulator FecR n=1 Tax=Cesiribacter andamanensis AMV16 TaxID=1279009 RepID=M7N023_9BACT|nr:FecR domain-containing protein [Cesiribacter andamanensis]EMR00647.1 fec operon regulator FecR [Cesiribacter andamanensis AMV16]